MSDRIITRDINGRRPEYAAYFSQRAIPSGVYAKVLGDYEDYKAFPGDVDLLQEYLVTQLLRMRKEEIAHQGLDQHILYLASGSDGIPGSVFGQKNVVMTSLNADHYYKKRSHTRIARSPKIEAHMFENPFAPNTFDTIFTNLDLISPSSLRFYAKMKEDMADIPRQRGEESSSQPYDFEESLGSLASEVRRIAKPGAIWIMLLDRQAEKYPTGSEFDRVKAILKKSGWDLSIMEGTSLAPMLQTQAHPQRKFSAPLYILTAK